MDSPLDPAVTDAANASGSSSRSSPFTRAARRDQSLPSSNLDDASVRWTQTREDDTTEPPSGAPTPAPESADNLSSSYFTGSTSSGSATPALKSRDVDAEDEDVRIAIMALGAMKNLDGKTEGSTRRGRTSAKTGTSASESGHSSTERKEMDSSSASVWPSSGISTSSVTSTAISSPSSTPATEFTQGSISTPSGSVTSGQFGSSSTAYAPSSGRRPATLADLPSDFEFPAIVQDENGNEVEVDQEMLRDADFLKRVSHLPIVRGTLRAYELGKQRSKIVKYGGDLVESSVKAISRPVVGRLQASLGDKGKEQLDDFACRQLDRFYPSAADSLTKEERQRIVAELDEKEKTEWAHMDEEERTKRRKAYFAIHIEQKEREAVVSELRQRKGRTKSGEAGGTLSAQPTTSGGQMTTHYQDETMSPPTQPASAQSGLVARRDSSGAGTTTSGARSDTPSAQLSSAIVENASRTGANSGWSSMLVEAGATAGGLSAAMSEESMKSLKYCLQWLQYATAHIEHQITVLRDLIVKLNHGELELTSPAAQNLTQIKGDVVHTIRGVVDIVGKYAGGALPEPARVSVKAFILSLPARWATVNRASAVSSGSSQFGGSPASPSFSPAHLSGGPSTDRSSTTDRNGQMTAAATAQAANRVLTLAVESLDILRSVTVVVGESLDRADVWVERLRMIGLQRKRQHDRDGWGGDERYIDEGSSQGWESARGLSAQHRNRRESVGAGSEMSMGTSASTKRRRMRSNNGGSVSGTGDEGSALKSPATPHSQLKSSGPVLSGGSSGGGSTAIAAASRQGAGAGGSNVFNVGVGGSNSGTSERRRRGKGGAATPTFPPLR